MYMRLSKHTPPTFCLHLKTVIRLLSLSGYKAERASETETWINKM